MKTSFAALPFATALLAASAGLASSAQALELPAGRLSYVIERDGSPVGHHSLTFNRAGPDHATVDIKTEVAVKALFVTVYRFEHQGHEDWRGERLVGLDSQTNDDGTKHQLHVVQQGDGLQVSSNGTEQSLPQALVPASLWNQQAVVTVGKGHLLNTLDGSVMAVQVEDLGTDTVDTPNGPEPSRHYRISGDLAREVWYSPEGWLAGVSFTAKDGSHIHYRLDQVSPLAAVAKN